MEVFAKGKEEIVEEAGGFSKEWKDLLKESEDLHVLKIVNLFCTAHTLNT